MIRILSPIALVVLCWGLSGLITSMTLLSLDRLDLVQTFMQREDLSVEVFGVTGAIWLVLALLAYIVADLAARLLRSPAAPPEGSIKHAVAAQVTIAVNLILLAVTAMWILTAAAKTGGLMALAAAAYVDSLTARDLLLESKLFAGMRLFYAALPATGALAAALLARGGLTGTLRRMLWLTLLVNIAALFVLPIVMSQRLLLLQLLASAYIASCLVRRRMFGLGWLMLGVLLFLGLWMAREAITNPLFQRSALDIGAQKLAFYVVNDMWNAFAPLTRQIPHTWGALNFEGMMFLTFTDGYFGQLLGPRMGELDSVLGGGEFPFLTSAYVDFGPVAGLCFIACAGFIFRRVHARAETSLPWAVVYGQIGAALLFSSHSVYFTHQNFLFSVVLIGGIVRISSGASARLPRGVPA